MDKRNRKIHLRDRQNLETRLKRKQSSAQPDPGSKDLNVHFAISERTRAIGFGGIGTLLKPVGKLRLDRTINRNVVLLKTHVPDWESDHVPGIACNVLSGGTFLEEIERKDETCMKALAADRFPASIRQGSHLGISGNVEGSAAKGLESSGCRLPERILH